MVVGKIDEPGVDAGLWSFCTRRMSTVGWVNIPSNSHLVQVIGERKRQSLMIRQKKQDTASLYLKLAYHQQWKNLWLPKRATWVPDQHSLPVGKNNSRSTTASLLTASPSSSVRVKLFFFCSWCSGYISGMHPILWPWHYWVTESMKALISCQSVHMKPFSKCCEDLIHVIEKELRIFNNTGMSCSHSSLCHGVIVDCLTFDGFALTDPYSFCMV